MLWTFENLSVELKLQINLKNLRRHRGKIGLENNFRFSTEYIIMCHIVHLHFWNKKPSFSAARICFDKNKIAYSWSSFVYYAHIFEVLFIVFIGNFNGRFSVNFDRHNVNFYEPFCVHLQNIFLDEYIYQWTSWYRTSVDIPS